MKATRELWLGTLTALLVFASCHSGGLCLGAESSGWLAESTLAGLPPEAQDVVRAQVARYLGMVDLTGVPLLDPAVDWNVLANWPDRFTYQGRTYRLRLRNRDSESFIKLSGKHSVTSHMHVSAAYETEATTGATSPVVAPYAVWSSAGTTNVTCKWLGAAPQTVWHGNVFSLQLYSSGRLFRLEWQHPDHGQHTAVYSHAGKRIGRSIARPPTQGKPAMTSHEWRGKSVDRTTFLRRSQEQSGQYYPPRY